MSGLRSFMNASRLSTSTGDLPSSTKSARMSSSNSSGRRSGNRKIAGRKSAVRADRPRWIAKLLEAAGIAAVMLGFVQGVYGDMWGELYLFLGGVFMFLIGRRMEKAWEIRQAAAHPGKIGRAHV